MMGKRVKHDLLGFKTNTGQIIAWPERYASFKNPLFSRVQNPTPTQVMIGPNHFCVMPIGSGDIDIDVRAELTALVQTPIATNEKKPKTAKNAQDNVDETKQ